MIEIKNLFKSYGKQPVLQNINLALKEGMVTSIIGANAAGKSTLLGIIARLIKIDRGEILLDGAPLSAYTPNEIAQTISILKQSNGTNLKITVQELVEFGRFPYSKGRLTDKDHQMVQNAIEYMGICEITHKYIDQLSGGQRQRVYIAMILAQDTKYIFLDEPLNNLDMKYATEMMTVLKKLCKELNKSIVIVMHDINYASIYSDWIIALRNGEVVQEGPPHEIITKVGLKNIYNHDFEIINFDDKQICMYYTLENHGE